MQTPGASNLGRTVGQGQAPSAGQRVGQLLGGWGLVAWAGDGVADAVMGRDGVVQRDALLRAGTDAGPASSVAGAASASLNLVTGAVGWLAAPSAATPLELTRALLQEGLELRSGGTDGVASMLGRLWVAGARGDSSASASADDILAPPREADERTPAEEWLIEVTQAEKVMGVSLTAGLVWWLTRGGGVIASALMGVPAWRQIDLLPVMLAAEEGAGDEPDDADDDVPDASPEDHRLVVAQADAEAQAEDLFARSVGAVPRASARADGAAP